MSECRWCHGTRVIPGIFGFSQGWPCGECGGPVSTPQGQLPEGWRIQPGWGNGLQAFWGKANFARLQGPTEEGLKRAYHMLAAAYPRVTQLVERAEWESCVDQFPSEFRAQLTKAVRGEL